MLNCSTVCSIACLSIGNGHLLIQWQCGRPNHILQIADYSYGAWLTIQQYGLGYWALWRQPVLLLQMVGPTVIWLFCQLAQITSGSSALRRTRGVQQLHLVKGRRWVCKETRCSSSSNVMLCLFFLMFLALKRSWELKKDTFELENKSHYSSSSSHTETRNRLICLTMSYLLLIQSSWESKIERKQKASVTVDIMSVYFLANKRHEPNSNLVPTTPPCRLSQLTNYGVIFL